MNADLHCHSTVSDGRLSPAEVARRAAEGGVQLWALTDHDEVRGIAQARAAAAALRMRYVVDAGHAASTADVFGRYLAEGKPGYVPHRWAALDDAMGWILGAGGVAVLAHPGRYKYTPLEFDALLSAFKQLGGEAIEVVTGSHTPDQYREYAQVARRFGFQASRGSDFHASGDGATELGSLPPLPADLTPYFRIHPDNPQPRLIKQAAQIIDGGGVVALPTDSSYALACHLDDKAAVERLRRIRGLDERRHLSLMVRDLSELATFAMVDNRQYRLIKSVTPGPYVFILQATKEVPRRLSHPSRKTIGLRVPDHAITRALLEALGQPVIASTLILPGEHASLNDPGDIRARLEKQLELVIDGGACAAEPSTVIDISGDEPVLVRAGRGPLAPLGLAR
ncbi:hypothetical protein DFQ30_000228, partial [Apophysomyces sp. BC1015]